MSDAGSTARRCSPFRRTWTLPVGIAVLALLLRLWAPGPVTQTGDEFTWLYLSDGFRTAVLHRDFARATAGDVRKVKGTYPTVPGVTTMWAGTLGYASVSAAHSLGLASHAPRAIGPSVLRAARGFVALWCSIALGLLVAIAVWLVGRRAAAVAGVLLATEPWLVGLSDVLHTDAMVTMFGGLSVVALLAGLQAARPRTGERSAGAAALGVPARARIPLIVLSGVAFALAVLTKLNAAPLLFGAGAIIVVVDALAARRDAAGAPGWGRRLLAQYGRLTGIWVVASLVVIVVLWPALWVAPHDQLTLMRLSLTQLKKGQGTTYFRERLTADAGATYYPVAMLFRMTPWFLAGAVVASVGVLLRSVWGFRRWSTADAPSIAAATLLVATLPYAVALTVTSQKYDRYSLPLFPFLAIACGVGASGAVGWVARRVHSTRWVVPTGVAATAILAGLTLSYSPYAISYVDPLVGGQVRARRNILLGAGEGLEALGAEVRHRDGTHCQDIRIAGPLFFVIAFPCGQLVSAGSLDGDVHRADYYVSYVTAEQRSLAGDRQLFSTVRRTSTLVKTVRIGGVDYAELWKIRPGA